MSKEIQLTADDFFQANNVAYMKKMTPEKRDAMIRTERGCNPKCCSECEFFYYLKDRDGKIYGGGCTIDEDIMITDKLERSLYCPL